VLTLKTWLMGLCLGLLLFTGWVLRQSTQAVVAVRFEAGRPGEVLDFVSVIVGADRQQARGLSPGGAAWFAFTPDSQQPVVLVFKVGEFNGDWEGPALSARQRLNVTLNGRGEVAWTECRWPCW